MNFKLSKESIYLGIVCLAAIVVMLPIVIFGIPRGNDLPQHYQFAQAYHDSLINGDGFPNLSARENFGYGSIGIRFYPPAAYYVLAFARIAVGNWFDASWLTFMFWMILSCLGVYFWSRWWLNAKESAIAAVFYAIAPHHLSQLYISFVYADFAGAAVLPFCFGFLTRVLERGKKSDILGLAVAYAVLVLTHLPTTIIGSFALAIYALIFLRREKWLDQIFKTSAAIVLGLAASSFYWFRMVSEMRWLNHAGEEYSSGHYYFGNRFYPLVLHRIESDYKENLLLSDILTSFCLLFLVSAVVYLFYRKTAAAEISPAARIFRTVLPLGVFAFFMITPLSYPLWKIITPLQKIQFPMRWMAVVSMCGAIVTAAAVHFLLKGDFLKKRVWVYTAIIFPSLFLILNFTYMWYPSAFMPIEREQFLSDMRELPNEQNHIFWWSVWSKKKALVTKDKIVAGDRAAAVNEWKPEKRNFTVISGEPTKVRVATFYYPHWKATVNDNSANVEMDENGAMFVSIPAEKSTVKMYFEEPSAVRIAALFSILAWLLIAAAFIFGLLGRFAGFDIAQSVAGRGNIEEFGNEAFEARFK